MRGVRRFRHGKPRGSNVIRVEVPLSQMFGYATDLPAARKAAPRSPCIFRIMRSASFDRSGSDREGDRQGGQINRDFAVRVVRSFVTRLLKDFE